MRTSFSVAALAVALGVCAPAFAQDSNPTFRGIRVEGNVGGDRFQSQGVHHDKLGYGATVGFDGVIDNKIVVGPEASYWRANNWTDNCTGVGASGTLCNRSFQEYGAAVRAGYLVTPNMLVFAKGGYANNEQRKLLTGTTGGYYDHYSTDGYQVGGGAEYTVMNTTSGVLKGAYVSAQYVFSQYNDHTSRQRAMLGVGLRFK